MTKSHFFDRVPLVLIKFSFSKTGCPLRLKSCLPYYLPIAERKTWFQTLHNAINVYPPPTPDITQIPNIFFICSLLYKLSYQANCFMFSTLILWCLICSTSMFSFFNYPISFKFVPDFMHSWQGVTEVFHHSSLWIAFLDELFQFISAGAVEYTDCICIWH